jgi:peptidoglycan/LPS O-acetylase OafA/YrhL
MVALMTARQAARRRRVCGGVALIVMALTLVAFAATEDLDGLDTPFVPAVVCVLVPPALTACCAPPRETRPPSGALSETFRPPRLS